MADIPAFDPTKYGGGSSSGGSSGGSTKKKASKPFSYDNNSFRNTQTSTFASIWTSLWGEKPSPNYIYSKVDAGWSTWEFEAHERAKPSFKYSPRYAEETTNVTASLAQMLGALG